MDAYPIRRILATTDFGESSKASEASVGCTGNQRIQLPATRRPSDE